ncbi:3870_t:CDS:2 [Cetraspora pellucida]|uniref:3870_t:CDS:1 n=1 Tax=Cetraspora pellucida TaxID=1433469 RepID=A0ACA9KY38_9GLOM|nr:3870_t:CDS:2 [Cetraspora pellucida]
MPQIHTLSDMPQRGAPKEPDKGNKLGDLSSNRYPPNNKRMQQDLNRSNKDKEKLSKHTYQLIDEVKRLRSELDTLTIQITRKDISLNESKIKALVMKLSSAQKDLSIKESEIDSFRVKLSALNSNLASKNNELEHIKNMLASKNGELVLMKNDLAKKNSDIHSLEARLSSEQIKIGGETDEKNYDNGLAMQSLPKNPDFLRKSQPSEACEPKILSLAKYLVYKSKTEDGQVNETSDTGASLLRETNSSNSMSLLDIAVSNTPETLSTQSLVLQPCELTLEKKNTSIVNDNIATCYVLM